MRCCIAVVVLLAARTALAAEDLTVLPSGKDEQPGRMLHTYLLAEAQKHFDARRNAVAELKSPADVKKRQHELYARFVTALGGFPEKTPLNARVAGKEQRDGYRIEKVVYESRPEHHVTATLYLPDGNGPFPGVLMPIGHSLNGKAAEYVQRGSILLAKNGLAVLAYDPIGQGEPRQLLDPAGKPALPSSTNEHTMVGVGALLVGSNTAAYRVWDGIRSLDYLASRPEVDAKRLGCTGCSGGGTLTSYLMALDDRIQAAAPSCYLTSLERLFATIGPQDAEQNIPGQVAFGMEHADYVTLRAPRPTLICAATRDFFDIQGTWTTFREAKRIYGTMGHGERVDLFESDTTHGYPKPQREAVVRWMRRWLLEKDDAPTESDFAIAKDADLLCTRTGQVLEEFKGKSAFDLNAQRERELARKRPALTGDALRKEVRRLLALPATVSAAKVKEVGTLQRNGYRIRKLVFETEPGISVPGLLFEPEGKAKGLLEVHVSERGKAAEAGPGGLFEKRAADGRRVLAIDVRGTGETAPGVVQAGRPNFFGVDYKEAFLSLHLARPLLGQRVLDILSVLAQTADDAPEGVHLTGAGPREAMVALHAAALEDRVKELTLERPLISWSAVVHTPISHDQLTNVVPGALAVYDLPDLAAAFAPRSLTIRGPVNPVGEPVTGAALETVYKPVEAAYARVKAEGSLSLTAAP